jgi:hypothetical protein
MILFAISPGDVLPTLGVLTALFVLLVLLLLLLVRPLELKLITVGLLTAVLSAWFAQMPVEGGATVQVGPAPAAAVGRVVVGGEAAGTLGRVAVLLILGGLAVGLLTRWGSPAPPAPREGTGRGNPV